MIETKPMFNGKEYLGLMFWQRGNVLLPNGPIHTWFCRPMKLVYIKDNKVKKIIHAKPWKTFQKIDADFIFETTYPIKIKTGERVDFFDEMGNRITQKIKRSNKKRK